MENKIIEYCSISPDKIKTNIENKNSFNTNIVNCISLQDVDSFTMTEMPNIQDLIAIYKEGFILEDIKYNNLIIFTRYTRSNRNRLLTL